MHEQKELQPITFGIKLPPALISIRPSPDIQKDLPPPSGSDHVLSSVLINRCFFDYHAGRTMAM